MRRRLFSIIPQNEKRFWPLVRCLLLPFSALAFFAALVIGVAAALGEKIVFWQNQPIIGWRGLMLAIAYFPVFALSLTFVTSLILFWDRTIVPFWKRRYCRLRKGK